MESNDIVKKSGFAGSDFTCLGRVSMNGALITQATIASINRLVYERQPAGSDDEEIDDTDLVVADSVFDTLQTDDIWGEDSTGYNFKDTVTYDIPDTKGKVYEVYYTFTGSSDEVFKCVYQYWTEDE